MPKNSGGCPRTRVIDSAQLMADEVVLIVALILERPLCLDCIAMKGGMSLDEAGAVLQRVTAVLELQSESARCRSCGATAKAFSVERSQDTGPRRPNRDP